MRLNRALYGLRQAPRAWHMRLSEELQRMGLSPSSADPSLCISASDPGAWVLVYVDDMLIIGSSVTVMQQVKQQIQSVFKCRDLGEPKVFLGMEVLRDRSARTIKLTQRGMVRQLVEDCGLLNSKPRPTPLSVSTRLEPAKEGDELLEDPKQYGSLVGRLAYLAACTRPDIANAVGVLSRFNSKPTVGHMKAALNVVRYLHGTVELGIQYGGGSGSMQPLVFTDSDYAGDLQTRRSTTGFVVTIAGGAVSWSSKLQHTVATSTVEAEYMAAAAAIKEALWMRKLLADLSKPVGSVEVMGDNMGMLSALRNPVQSVRTKHIDVAHHFARERVARKEVTLTYVPTERMVADALTKALSPQKFEFCRMGMGMR
jgi:hypothetical protein